MKRALLCLLVLVLCIPAIAQQKDINRVGFFTGYSYINTPSLGLSQHGFNGSAGINLNRWAEFGGDFSVLNGSTPLGVSQTKLGPILANSGLPSSIVTALAGAKIPIEATTYTYQIGGQINIRRWEKITPFIRPVLGAMHETVNVNLTQTLAALPPTVAPLVAQALAATGLKSKVSDTVPMYGVGGGVDFNVSKHFGLRVSIDYAHTKMFESMLEPQNTVRISVGPTWKFGELKQNK